MLILMNYVGFGLKNWPKKCGLYMKIEEIYYLNILGKSLDEGLMRAYDDKEVLQMSEIVLGNRCIDSYVLHGVNEPKIAPMIDANILVDGVSG